MEERQPELSVVGRARGPVGGVALVLHGGSEFSSAAVRPWRLAYLRMLPFAIALSRSGAWHGLDVRLLRNRVRGWNEPAMDPLADARWALDRIRAERPGVPVVLVGHSLGGRVALRAADDPAVVGACALAPWTPQGEPVEPVAGRAVLIAHGTHDRVTSPVESLRYAEEADPKAARLARFEVAAEGHAMLRRPSLWNRLVVTFVLRTLGLPDSGQVLDAAWESAAPARFRLPL
ncbi:alpha/beta hydrolase [Prauserella marina]|uniref:Alpha/beta hydrolase family protein n=1 Tax=Prauserella marina TaxID=530584 RepID=A0A222VZV4_9PSEU|nr:alpha/beta fold hydrolase [Prauserella marina]ASR39467.1 alpha/beta hydrolase [Prauserella marina]PWV80255.1 alpha/beta hydrolase family protein [Prauserella marina]SDD50363.1 Alpha/beta hydrolase family protein [Prauserella marina]